MRRIAVIVGIALVLWGAFGFTQGANGQAGVILGAGFALLLLGAYN